MYSPLPLLYFFLLVTLLLLSSCRHEGVRPVLPGLQGLLGVRLPVVVPMAPCSASESSFIVFVLRFRCIRHFVINVISNIRISIYYVLFVICAVIYCSFCCIYVWLDPGTYMIARFMSFLNRVLQSGIRAISTVGRSLHRTGRVLGLLLSDPCLLKLFYYYAVSTLGLLPVLPWFLSLKNSFHIFWPKSVIWPSWVLDRWPPL